MANAGYISFASNLAPLLLLLATPLPFRISVFSTSKSAAVPVAPRKLDGNWEVMMGSPSVGSVGYPISLLNGTLHSSGSSVHGTLCALDINILSPCVAPNQDLPVTGTWDETGQLSITMPITAGTATIDALLTSDLRSNATASVEIIGGDCAMSASDAIRSNAGSINAETSVGDSEAAEGLSAHLTRLSSALAEAKPYQTAADSIRKARSAGKTILQDQQGVGPTRCYHRTS